MIPVDSGGRQEEDLALSELVFAVLQCECVRESRAE